MYVCICRAVSNRTIESAIAAGAKSVESVGLSCGAGTVCGGCHNLIEIMLAGGVTLAPRVAR